MNVEKTQNTRISLGTMGCAFLSRIIHFYVLLVADAFLFCSFSGRIFFTILLCGSFGNSHC